MKDAKYAGADRIADLGLKNGVWSILAMSEGQPDLAATHLGIKLTDVTIAADDAGWRVSVALPPTVLSDGVQTILLHDVQGGEPVASLTVASGSVLAHEVTSEVALLRAELELLKRAFRRHCADADR